MKVTAQVLSDKGFYGPTMNFNVRSVAEISDKLVAKMDHLPDSEDGVSLTAWTSITIKIDRN